MENTKVEEGSNELDLFAAWLQKYEEGPYRFPSYKHAIQCFREQTLKDAAYSAIEQIKLFTA